jgi:hypothetical protein
MLHQVTFVCENAEHPCRHIQSEVDAFRITSLSVFVTGKMSVPEVFVAGVLGMIYLVRFLHSLAAWDLCLFVLTQR